MKRYDFYGAPNPKRLRMDLTEKGIEIEKISIDLVRAERRTDDFRVLDGIAGERPFIAGDRRSNAEFRAYAALGFADATGHPVDLGRWPNVQRWFGRFSQRPSAEA